MGDPLETGRPNDIQNVTCFCGPMGESNGGIARRSRARRCSWELLGAPFELSGAPWGSLGGPLGLSWGRLGRLLGRLAGVLDALGPLGSLLGALGGVLESPWARGVSWGALGASWGPLGGLLGLPGGVLESPRGVLGSVGDKAKMERSQENELGSIKMEKWHCFLFFWKTENSTSIWAPRWKRECLGRPWALLGMRLGHLGAKRPFQTPLRFENAKQTPKTRQNIKTKKRAILFSHVF